MWIYMYIYACGWLFFILQCHCNSIGTKTYLMPQHIFTCLKPLTHCQSPTTVAVTAPFEATASVSRLPLVHRLGGKNHHEWMCWMPVNHASAVSQGVVLPA